MAEEYKQELSNIFCPVAGQPMEFAIVRDKLTNIEIQRTCKYIKEGGGKFVKFDPQNNNQINLASKRHVPLINLKLVDIGYVKKCVNHKKLMDLRDFRLRDPGEWHSGCIPPQVMLSEPKCKHRVSAEEVLKMMKSLK